MASLLQGIRATPVPLRRVGAMNRVLDTRPPRRRRRSSDGLAPAVSVLRWRSGHATDGVFEMFSAQEAGRFGSPSPPTDSPDGENVLFVSASRRAAPDTPAVLLSLVNTSPSEAVRLSIKLAGRAPKSLAGTILTAPSMTPRREGAGKRFRPVSRRSAGRVPRRRLEGEGRRDHGARQVRRGVDRAVARLGIPDQRRAM